MSERHDPGAADLRRRDFLKVAATAAAAGGVYPAALSGATIGPSAFPRQQAQEALPIPLGQGEAPAVQFQAYPGGTGALMEKLWREHGAELFERHPIEIAPWTGPVPTDEVDLAFLPVHRLSALVREGHVSSVELTEIYLERIKRYDPELLFVVTLLEGRAREESQQADADLRAGRWRGPLHGIPYGVKDLFSVRGARTTWGSADFEDQVRVTAGTAGRHAIRGIPSRARAAPPRDRGLRRPPAASPSRSVRRRGARSSPLPAGTG
jgi:hypothetical protein